MYLKDHSPYLDSLSLVVVNLRIQLELICWANTPQLQCTSQALCFTYIPSPLADLTVFTAQSSVIFTEHPFCCNYKDTFFK